MKILIVGGVAGGASFAARMRRLNEDAEIVLFEKGEYVSFANCGLPYYIGGEIAERDALLLQSVEQMEKKFNMKVYNNTEVTKIDRKNKSIEFSSKDGTDGKSDYDYLILSPGASPVKPPIEGISEAKNVFTLRTVPDTDAIKSYIKNNNAQEATVIGGGFIGLEMAENLKRAGLKTTLIEMDKQVMAPLDFEMAQELHMHLEDKGVRLILNNGVKKFKDKGAAIELSDGSTVHSDITILAIGVKPENTLAKDAGLAIGARGGIVVNSQMQTSDEYIYALGDAAEVNHFVSGEKVQIALAGYANYQGRMIADLLNGMQAEYKGSLGTSIAKVFDLQAASIGLNEKTIKGEYQVIHLHPVNHAAYYPGSYPMHVKVLYSTEGKILGAQCVAKDGADKFIDTIATAIYAGLSITQLKDLQLAYAPPFNAAKTAINFVGYVSENALNKKVSFIQCNEIEQYKKDGYMLVDVSEAAEFAIGHIDGSVNIPLGTIRDNINTLQGKKIVLYCRVSLRAYNAHCILRQKGIDSVVLSGGYKTYAIANYKLKNTAAICGCPLSAHNQEEKMIQKNVTAKVEINACGLQCPGPITRVYTAMNELADGDVLEVKVTDIGFTKDINSWCSTTGNTLIGVHEDDGVYTAQIMKGKTEQTLETKVFENHNSATIIVFSGDLDKTMAAFIIANGAASMGKKVTMFFTFWGLSAVKRRAHAQKNAMEKMFDIMLPADITKLGLSKMNMAGMGSAMMKKIMKEKNVDDLPTLMQSARNLGVKLIACSMSMDVMGIKKEELLEGVEIGGVATYLGDAQKSGINLFI
ncbi:FAD-dependent oxidoreductase [Treponema phagedenis]|uniref:FAD-dependent oxidoreductase n=1 Tax=Treponema phagedenis TaxID=162 RepID=UPI0004637D84|nr:FAD-dependent oxidoreductase [Treponema phagedenis]QEK02162.1 pyridine nucleotide-disulfide oxidoreductase [Treponema phagedenis]QEK07364.1 pyridine nucleotide-disulfide oxidoreductase [Treponema phagedenis]